MNLPARGPASTNLPTRSPTLRTCPPVVQHMWSISPRTSLHVASLNVSTEHTNLPRSYPHVRVTRYEPPRLYHHMSNTIHEPTRSWHNISRSKCRSIAQSTHQTTKGQQHFRLARPTHRQAKLYQTAWRYLLTARRQRPVRATVLSSPLGRAHRASRRHSRHNSLILRLSPGGIQWTARRHTRNILQLVLAPSLNGSELECYRNHHFSHSS